MQHKLKLTLSAALAIGLLSVSATSAGATTYRNGIGAFEAASTLNPPPEECATYRAYNATLTFTDAAVPVTATVSSSRDPNSSSFQWGEFADGTYTSTHCSGSGGAQIAGFTGTLTGGANCTLSGGTYQRGRLGTVDPEVNVRFSFASASTPGTGTTCAGVTTPVVMDATIPHRDLPVPLTVGPFEFAYLSACNSPIAPQTCALGPAAW